MTSPGTENTNVVDGDQDRNQDNPSEHDVATDNTTPEGADPDGTSAETAVTEPAVPDSTSEQSSSEQFAPQPPAAPLPPTAAASSGSRGGLLGGLAVVSTGLGLSSLIGNPLSDMLRARQEIMGQIEAGMGGGGGDQIEAFYGAPWNTTALVNGSIALVAVLVGAIVLAVNMRRAESRAWVTGLAVGGAVLGLIGVLLAGGMYLDLFAGAPELPAAPPMVPGG
ncbi:hypothetical protein [Saccharomonospora sp. CUA-673]|uniref:hypothetical protein n=1 Tax=Saccharomonospora sp. CUA-673 TaxID=1904969 RepID=UPI0009FA1746|nr:hypothetical protein [Saccharomonospora sp. CUA-673]